MLYCIKYLKIKAWVVFCFFFRLWNSRWLTEHNIYMKHILVYISVLGWDIDFFFQKLPPKKWSYQQLPKTAGNCQKRQKNCRKWLEIAENSQKTADKAEPQTFVLDWYGDLIFCILYFKSYNKKSDMTQTCWKQLESATNSCILLIKLISSLTF